MNIERVVCWYSGGVTSAIATKIALDKYRGVYPVEIVYIDTGSEHPDTERFIADCESIYEQKIVRLKSEKYFDIWDVFEKTRYLSGPDGARCTLELKKKVRQKYENIRTDLSIMGYDYREEQKRKRGTKFKMNNPEIMSEFPLIEKKLSKRDCMTTLTLDYGIDLPEMYKLGFNNNNCVGCVKGKAGYWNLIRIHFPDVFERMSKQERELDIAIIRENTKKRDENGKLIMNKIFLDSLPPEMGQHYPVIESCDLFCGG